MSEASFTAIPIGVIATPWRAIEDCPRNGRQPDPAPVCRVRVFEPFLPGLRGLEGMSHRILIYWLVEVKSPHLVFTPPFDTEPRVMTATRGLLRPNPIYLSVVAFFC